MTLIPRLLTHAPKRIHRATLPILRRESTSTSTSTSPVPARQVPVPVPVPVPSPTYTELPSIPDTDTGFTTHFVALERSGVFPRGCFTAHVPAIAEWFAHPAGTPDSQSWALSQHFLDSCPEEFVPIEVTQPDKSFSQTLFPLPLFLTYLSQPRPASLPALYLAQYPLPNASALTAKLTPPPPPVPKNAALPTLWLGTSGTSSSPLHRDPRPNVFVQLAGRKVIKMFPPAVGEKVMEQLLGEEVAKRRLRGAEMMGKEERSVVDGWVWGVNGRKEDEKAHGEEGYEVELGSGDGVFIPRGWWHAVKAVREVEQTGREGICASVNWWF